MTSTSPSSPIDDADSLLNTPELSENDPIHKILQLPASPLFQNMSLSLSGKFPPLTQQQMRTLLRKHGAQVSATPRKKTQYIICGERCATSFPEWCICVNKEWVFDSIEKGRIIDPKEKEDYLVPVNIGSSLDGVNPASYSLSGMASGGGNAAMGRTLKRKKNYHNPDRVLSLLRISPSELDHLFKFPGILAKQLIPSSSSSSSSVSTLSLGFSNTMPTSETSADGKSNSTVDVEQQRNPENIDFQRRIVQTVPYSPRLRYADPYADFGDAEVLFYDNQSWSEMYSRMSVRDQNLLEKGDPEKGIFLQPAFLSKEVFDEYFLIQILVFKENGQSDSYVMHTRWGVVGQGHLGIWQKAFNNITEALSFYKLTHLKLTDNDFNAPNFSPRKNCYVPLSFEIPLEYTQRRQAEQRMRLETRPNSNDNDKANMTKASTSEGSEEAKIQESSETPQDIAPHANSSLPSNEVPTRNRSPSPEDDGEMEIQDEESEEK